MSGLNDDGWTYPRFNVMVKLMYNVLCELVWWVLASVLHISMYVIIFYVCIQYVLYFLLDA